MHEFFDRGDAGHGFLMFTYEDGVLNEEPLAINLNTRTISVPSAIANCAGVQTDRMAEMLIFEVDRFFDYMDLANSKMKFYVQWETPEGKDAHGNVIPAAAGSTEVDFIDYITKPGKILFAWPITADIAQASGVVKFSVRFFKLDDTGKVAYSLNTQSATISIKPALLAPDAKPNVITPLMSNLFESVILDSDAADGVKIPFSPWFATPGSDISLLENYDPSTFRGTVVPLSKADSRYIANLKNDTLTFCAQAVTYDLAEIDYEWTYIPANAKTAADIHHSIGDDVYLFAGTEDYFSGERVDSEGNKVAVDAPTNERFYVRVQGAETTATGFKLYEGDFPVGGDVDLYERYTTYEIPVGDEDVTGYYFVTTTGAFSGVTSEPRESSRCELPGPQPIEIKTDLLLSNYLLRDEDNNITAVNLSVNTGDNPYNATMTYAWKKQVNTTDGYEDISNNSNTLAVSTPGWYKVDISSILNREAAEPVTSNVCLVTELPAQPNVENKTEFGGQISNNIPLTKTANKVVLKVEATLPEGYDINNPLHHEKFNYKWYISLVNQADPHEVTEADKEYAVANGDELTVYWNDKVDYASFNCIVENELNGKVTVSEFMANNIFVDYK